MINTDGIMEKWNDGLCVGSGSRLLFPGPVFTPILVLSTWSVA